MPGGVDVTGVKWVKVRDATQHPTRRTALTTQNYPAQNVSSGQAEKSWFRKKANSSDKALQAERERG